MGKGEDKCGTDEPDERKPVTPEQQRVYDALVIKAFRADKRMMDIMNWIKPWNVDLQKHNLKRCPKNVYYMERVQEMVGRFMRPLADRLWDTERSQDVATLNWMAKIQLGQQDRKWDSERAAMRKKSNADRVKAGLLRGEYETHLRNNQWKVTK